ncbi:aminopeptidase N [Teleopsis dalmanni]|uniref:aminopeptidase N n=1 Tax=Teleopsis dalmanni TaxID=139649 RepID=UPI0018CDA08B|nr:aminopeptidase N [Teleopsis dalmanni]
MILKVLLILLIIGTSSGIQINKRSVDLSASQALISDVRLPKDVIPENYELRLYPNIDDCTFEGNMKMNIFWKEDSKKISFHAHYDLQIFNITIKKLNESQMVDKNLDILRTDQSRKTSIFVIYLKEVMKKGTKCLIELNFNGQIYFETEGLFKSSYVEAEGNQTKEYLATNMRLLNARRLFPCFDEPAFKVPFTVSIIRPKKYTTLFNTPLVQTTSLDDNNDIDQFEKTWPMSTYAFGFIIIQLQKFDHPNETLLETDFPTINLWATSQNQLKLENMYAKLRRVYLQIQIYLNTTVPLSKIDVVAIPKLVSVQTLNNCGLLVFQENEISQNGYLTLAQQFIQQWIGCCVSPHWWNDFHINKALANFVAAEMSFDIDTGLELNGMYPMTKLYTLYYELSKRFPHSKITGMKQESISYKTELLIRMLNFTLSQNTFRCGLRRFITEHMYGTFTGVNLWDSLTQQAFFDNTLSKDLNVVNIAESWILKDRLPVIKIIRNYANNNAKVTQTVYLRERPHDVPGQDKMIWSIPIVLVQQQKLNFLNFTPHVWMNKKEITIEGLTHESNFIIVNPEEIGPFPVNYDLQNWNLLSEYLQTKDGRNKLPLYTRAKLLHDAWNLAYAGELSFATALNMTLFMVYERNHVIWNPVFTFIDHISKHIDILVIKSKFEAYVRALLTPLYLELGEQSDKSENWKSDLRRLAKSFLCRVGYRLCIDEAQRAYQVWRESPHPDYSNAVANDYICPVFKWGTTDEWDFGLQRVIQFPKNRTQSERTYLLKMLAGCPIQAEKIYRLLNLTILESNEHFTETDLYLIFNMLKRGSSGYTTLFNFLSDHWAEIKQRFANKTNLWDNLINAATGAFTTQEGYDMVSRLYELRKNEFGSAEHIIKKSLQNIKEEAKWTSENIPVIENWLDKFLEKHNIENN